MSDIHNKPIPDQPHVHETSDSSEKNVQTGLARRTSADTQINPQPKTLQARTCHKAAMNALEKGQYEIAAQDFKVAADLGNRDALYQLALLYAEGKGVPQSDALKLDCLQKAANLGHDEASFMLAEIYSKDPQTADRALAFYEKAADQMHPGAQLRMAEILFVKGDFGTAKGFATKAISFFEEAKDLYLKDMTTDVGEAKFHEQEKNYMQANLVLGKIYLQNGESKEAHLCFERASTPQNPNSEALKHLGILYAEGIGVDMNYDQAIDFLMNAYEASGYNTTDGTIAEIDKIIDRLMADPEPLAKISKEKLDKIKLMYSGNHWKISTLVADYDTMDTVQQSLTNYTTRSSPLMTNYKKTLECSLLLSKNDKDKTFYTIEEFFLNAMRNPISSEKSETLLWLTHIYNDGVLVPRNATNALLCLLSQETLERKDRILQMRLFPEVKAQQDTYALQIRKREGNYYDAESDLIENIAHESVVQKYKILDRDYARNKSKIKHAVLKEALLTPTLMTQTSIDRIPKESLTISSETQEKLDQLNRDILKNMLHDPYLTDSEINELLELMYTKCPALAIPDSAYDTNALISISKESIMNLTKKIEKPIQNQREYAYRIQSDIQSIKESHKKHKGRIPFSELKSDKDINITSDDVDNEIKFLKGEETQTKGGIGSSMHLNNRPQELILEHVKPSDAYLDIGCGAGSQSYELLKKGATVVMNDPDARSLDLFKIAASELIPKDELNRAVNFNYGFFPEATKDLPDASFDGIVCNHVMHYTNPEQIQAMFAEMYRLLKPGGRIHIDAISPYHSYLFQFATALALDKMQKGEEWPSELTDTNQIFTEETGLNADYNTARHLPPYMHPQFSEVLAREASKAKLTIIESGYASFYSQNKSSEHLSRQKIIRDLLSNVPINPDYLLELPFEDKGISYIMGTKPSSESSETPH